MQEREDGMQSNAYKKKLNSYLPTLEIKRPFQILEDCEFVYIKNKDEKTPKKCKISGSIGAISFYLGDIIAKLCTEPLERNKFFNALQEEADKIAILRAQENKTNL